MAANEPRSPANEPGLVSPSIKHWASANEPKLLMSNDSGTPPPDLFDLDKPNMHPKMQQFPVITILGEPKCFSSRYYERFGWLENSTGWL